MNYELRETYTVLPITILLFLFFSSCAPIFSNFQSAETVGEKNLEITPFTSGIYSIEKHISYEYPSGKKKTSKSLTVGQQNLGIKVAYGMDPNTDLRFEIGSMMPADKLFDLENLGKYNMISAGPKISLIDTSFHNLSLNLIFGKRFTDEFEFSDGLLLKPGVLYTISSIKAKPTIGIRWLDELNQGNSAIAVNLGAQINSIPIIRPEIGVLTSSDLEDPVFQFGLGFSFNTDDLLRRD